MNEQIKRGSEASKINDVKREIFMCLLEGEDDKAMKLLAYYNQLYKQSQAHADCSVPEGAEQITRELRKADVARERQLQTKINDHVHNREYDRARVLNETLSHRLK